MKPKKKDNPPPNKELLHTPISILEKELTKHWSKREICQFLSISFSSYESMLSDPYHKLSTDRINKCAIALNVDRDEVLEMIELDYLLQRDEITPEQFRRILDLKSVRKNNKRDVATYAIASGLTPEDLEEWMQSSAKES